MSKKIRNFKCINRGASDRTHNGLCKQCNAWLKILKHVRSIKLLLSTAGG